MLLAFDVGIKHLAYCVLTRDKIIHHWALVNLTDLSNQPSLCITCQKPAKANSPLGLVCGRHQGKIRFEEKPTIALMKAFLTEHKLDTSGKKEDLVNRIATIASVALPKSKNAMSFAENTTRLHDAIRDWITRDIEFLSQVTHVYIEHQPVLKNPVMKTVQITLFCSLRERFLTQNRNVSFFWVHASKKVKAISGDEGYKDRKKGGIERVRTYFHENPSLCSPWLEWWESQSKKDDLADALCMVLDKI